MGGASWWVGLAVVQRLKCIDGHRLGPRKVAVMYGGRLVSKLSIPLILGGALFLKGGYTFPEGGIHFSCKGGTLFLQGGVHFS